MRPLFSLQCVAFVKFPPYGQAEQPFYCHNWYNMDRPLTLSNTHTCALIHSHTHRFLPFLLVLLWWDKNHPTKQNCTSVQPEQFLFRPLLHFKSKAWKKFSGILLLMRFKAKCNCKNWSIEGLPPYHTENAILCFTQLFICPLKQIQLKQFFTGMREG